MQIYKLQTKKSKFQPFLRILQTTVDTSVVTMASLLAIGHDRGQGCSTTNCLHERFKSVQVTPKKSSISVSKRIKQSYQIVQKYRDLVKQETSFGRIDEQRESCCKITRLLRQNTAADTVWREAGKGNVRSQSPCFARLLPHPKGLTAPP